MDESRQVSEQIRQKLAGYKEVVRVTTTITPRSANAFVTLVDRDERELSQQQLQQKMIARPAHHSRACASRAVAAAIPAAARCSSN